MLVGLAEFAAKPESAFDVIPDELVQLREIDIRMVEAVGEALVQLRTQAFRRSSVDSFLDEAVTERESALLTRADEAAGGQRREMRAGGRGGVRIEERDDVIGRELLPRDRPAFEHRPLAGAEPVEAGGEQRLDRLRQRALRKPAFQREREELLQEQRVAFGGVDDPRALIGLENRPAEAVEERVRLLHRELVESDPLDVREPLEEVRAFLKELLSRHAHDEHRPGPPVRELLDELEEGRLGPVDVVEDDDERLLARERFAELAEEQGDLGRRRRRVGLEGAKDRRALLALRGLR